MILKDEEHSWLVEYWWASKDRYNESTNRVVVEPIKGWVPLWCFTSPLHHPQRPFKDAGCYSWEVLNSQNWPLYAKTYSTTVERCVEIIKEALKMPSYRDKHLRLRNKRTNDVFDGGAFVTPLLEKKKR